MPPNQYNRICTSSCFAQLTTMRRCHVQAQLFRCIMLRELEASSVNAILFYVNGTTLRFTIREFAINSSLNCSDNGADFYFDTDQPNRIIDEYFPGDSPVIKARLDEAFKAKVWGDNQEDAYKFGILYYIHEFIMSAEPTTTTIDRLDFDLVETGRFMDYPWGRKTFNELAKSINNKIKPCGQYYRIQGFPLPLQVWFYECCSYVDDKIAVKVSSHIPRIINWVTKNDYPWFDYFMKTFFNDADNPIKFRNIEPTAMEIKILQLPPSTDQSISQGLQTDHNKVTDPDDDFQNPPSIKSRKGKEKKKKQSVTVISINKSSTKAIKTYTRRSMTRKAIRSQSSININSVEKHNDAGTSHNNKHGEQKGVQDSTQMGQMKKSISITISRDEFEAFKKSVNVIDDDQESPIGDFHHQPTYTPHEPQSQSANLTDQEATFEDVMQEMHITRAHQSNTKSSHYYFLFKLGDNLKELNPNSALLDQVVLSDNLNDLSGTASQDQLVFYATVDAQQNAQRETESSSNSWVIYNIYNVASHERIVEAEESIIVAAPIQMVYMPDSNQETVVTESQDELPDHLLPSVNTLQNIVLQKQVEAEVTPMSVVRHRRPGSFNISPYMTSFGSDAATIDNKNWFYNIGFERQLIDNSKGLDIASHHRYQGHTVYDSFKIVYVEELPQQPIASL
uniref:DUF1985 domain-containing protein n=1 Tax=Solanum lycopersicum TaxID=4081 RepID=A0A3Q7EG15_SOLLC